MLAEIVFNKHVLKEQGGFTYQIPVALQNQIEVGQLVTAPLKNKLEKGIVIKIQNSKFKIQKFELKEIEKIITPSPLLKKWQIEVARWMSAYYCAHLFQCLHLFLPTPLWQQKYSLDQELLVELLDKNWQPHPRSGWQKRLKKNLESGIWNIDKKEFKLGDLKKLEEKGIIQLKYGKIKNSLPTTNYQLPTTNSFHRFTPDQQKIFNLVAKSPTKKPFLLHGVTGSGKTEIYLQLAHCYFQQGKQALVLVPEIALTPQLIQYFTQTFKNQIAVIHSQLTEHERVAAWFRIQKKEAMLVIGSRSALFSPLQNPGLIVIDEEHEWTYKNEQAPRYHTRAVAERIANLTGSTLLLGSATPSVESYHKTQTGEYALLELPKKIEIKGNLS